MNPGPSFDRVRSRGSGSPSASSPDDHGPDPVDVQGKAALFSRAVATPSLGSVSITCSGCHTATIVTYLRALQLAVPSLHLVVLRRDYPSWMRCPACSRRTWVKVRFS
ncbi:MAG: hypothetical protein WCF04_03365 [Candidatus Nanopelagicales bacterium]